METLLYFSILHFKHAYPECTGEETRLTLSRWSAVQLYLLRESLSASFVINRCCKAKNNHYQDLTIYQRFISTSGKKPLTFPSIKWKSASEKVEQPITFLHFVRLQQQRNTNVFYLDFILGINTKQYLFLSFFFFTGKCRKSLA